jgi:hypothetical protein
MTTTNRAPSCAPSLRALLTEGIAHPLANRHRRQRRRKCPHVTSPRALSSPRLLRIGVCDMLAPCADARAPRSCYAPSLRAPLAARRCAAAASTQPQLPPARRAPASLSRTVRAAAHLCALNACSGLGISAHVQG